MKATNSAFITILLSLLSLNPLVAQISSPPNIVPSANTLTSKISDATFVSLYSGVPQIIIPLYTVSKGGISVPISLSYNASGVRPDIHPGWVGLGWQLQAAGAITRVVKDLPDDFSSTETIGDPESTTISLTTAGYNWRYAKLDNINWNDTSYMQSIARSYDSYRDTEPDEYSFNFPGYSGKFYRSQFGTWQIQCDRPIKVVADFPNEKFTIVGDDGTTYIFGGKSQYVTGTNVETTTLHKQEGLSVGDQATSSWYLDKIVSLNGDEVAFTYERDNFKTTQPVVIMSGSYDACHTFAGLDTTKIAYSSYPIFLTQITAGNLKVSFERSETTELKFSQAYAQDYFYRWKKLDKISVKLSNNELLMGFKFGYTSDTTKRLTLLSLTEEGKNARTKPPYQFFYDSSKTLPPYLSDKVDHWGFYNGQLADYSTSVDAYYSSRNPNEEYLFAGTLNKLINPNGGIREFTYEANKFSRQLGYDRSQSPPLLTQDQLSGGLRIRKIKTYDPDFPEQKKETEYFYVKNYTNSVNPNTLRSSGVLGGRVQYQYIGYFLNVYNHPGQSYAPNTMNSQSVIPGYTNNAGTHIGYSEVVEKRSDGSYTKYFFTNFDNGYLDEIADNYLQSQRTVYDEYNSKEIERGKLFLQKEYNASNVVVKSHGTTYTALSPLPGYVRAMRARHFFPCPDLKVEEGTAYKVYTYSFLPTAERDTVYNLTGVQPLITKTNILYESTIEVQVKEINTITSSGDTILTKFKYPRQMYAPGNIYGAMRDKNVLAAVVETQKMKNSVQMSITRADYAAYGVNKFAPESLSLQTVPFDPFRLKEQYQYDDKGNVVSRNAAQGPKTCYIYAYDGQYVIAEINNAEYADVAAALGGVFNITVFRNNLLPTDAQVNTFLAPLRTNTALKNAMVTTYTHAPYVGITSVTDAKGLTIFNQYDEFLRPSVTKDANGNILKQFNYNTK